MASFLARVVKGFSNEVYGKTCYTRAVAEVTAELIGR